MLSEKECLEVSRYGLPTTSCLGLNNIGVRPMSILNSRVRLDPGLTFTEQVSCSA